MRFSFTDEQLEFRAAARALFEAECQPSAVRAAADGGDGRNAALWRQLGDMGVLGLLAPDGYGGLGLTDVDLVGVLVESGRCALPDPLVETASVVVPLLATVGESTLLPGLIDGALTATVAGVYGSSRVTHADAAVVVALGHDAVRVFTDPDRFASRLPSIDRARRVFRFPDGVTTAATVLAEGDEAVAISTVASDRAAVGAAAQLVGLAGALLDMTVAYLKVREQFGVPIGSFQGLKHQMATALMELEFATPAVYRAAYTIAESAGAPTEAAAARDRSLHSSMAKAMASDAARLVARTCLQAHGAIGYTVEHDLHLWFKRVHALAAQWGDARWHRARVGALLQL